MSSTIWGSQGACPLAKYEAAPHARLARRKPPSEKQNLLPTNGRLTTAPSLEAPFPSSKLSLRSGGDLSRAASPPACEPLTNLPRSVQSRIQGKGAGVSGGLPPGEVRGSAPTARLGGRRPTPICPPQPCPKLPLRRALQPFAPPPSFRCNPPLRCRLWRAPRPRFTAADAPCFHPHSVGALGSGACWGP